ncbi:MAG: hypothetical protein CVV39_08885 [Planctomycetes bacterium HGW-Planctomycetes-1]|nr:MAG: hypothetical protein CVV39_08885 [Planctomycetes bacterium HGW-Planctomycetes-1]
MKKEVGVSIVLAFLFWVSCANATPIDVNIYSDTTISSGEYGTVNIYDTPPDQTTVTMTGGTAESVWAYNSSIFNMQNGNVSFVVSVFDNSTAVISGGSIQYLQLSYSGVASLSGGSINGSLSTGGMATVHFYGKNFNCIPHAGGGWLITGNWDDAISSPFTVWYRAGYSEPIPGSFDSPITLHIVPEPITLSFLLIGILGIRKFRG